MQFSDDTDLIQSLRDQLDAHVKSRISALPAASIPNEKDQSKELLKKHKEQAQAVRKMADWLTERGKKLARFPKNLIPGAKIIRDICTRLADHFRKVSKSDSSLSSAMANSLLSSDSTAKRISQLEQRIDKLEEDRVGRIMGLSRELKSLRAQVNELRKSQPSQLAP